MADPGLRQHQCVASQLGRGTRCLRPRGRCSARRSRSPCLVIGLRIAERLVGGVACLVESAWDRSSGPVSTSGSTSAASASSGDLLVVRLTAVGGGLVGGVAVPGDASVSRWAPGLRSRSARRSSADPARCHGMGIHASPVVLVRWQGDRLRERFRHPHRPGHRRGKRGRRRRCPRPGRRRLDRRHRRAPPRTARRRWPPRIPASTRSRPTSPTRSRYGVCSTRWSSATVVSISLFNNAGRGGSPVEIDEIDLAEWRAVVDLNVTGHVPVHP